MNLISELEAHLDGLKINGDTIGDIRRSCFVPWDSEWNGIVRDLTAQRERSVEEDGGESGRNNHPPTESNLQTISNIADQQPTGQTLHQSRTPSGGAGEQRRKAPLSPLPEYLKGIYSRWGLNNPTASTSLKSASSESSLRCGARRMLRSVALLHLGRRRSEGSAHRSRPHGQAEIQVYELTSTIARHGRESVR